MASVASNNYVLEMKTVQIAPVRTLMTALKDILLETNIVFSQDYTDSKGERYTRIKSKDYSKFKRCFNNDGLE